MAAAVQPPYSKITDVPKTVKEAIDWLIRIGELDNTQSGAGQPNSNNCKGLSDAIKALTGSNSTSIEREITPLIQGLVSFLGRGSDGTIKGGSIIKKNGYTSAYQQGTATWPTCNQGGQCSCCQQGSCNCTASPTKSCDGSCCNTCDVRICAGIFVALVPALETALRGLKDKLKKENGKTINQDPIKEHFTALGYQEGDLNTGLKGNIASSMLGRATRQLEEVKKRVLGRDGYFKGIENSASSTSVSSSSSNSPKTVREMLLWLMGLPYCQGYGEFVKKLTEETLKNLVTSTRPSSSKDSNPLAKQLSAVIFHLPTVFYSIEGGISYLSELFEQFKKDGQPKFDYPDKGDDLLKTLSAYVAVCYPILKYLMQRCDKDPRSRPRRGTGASATPVAEGNDGAWGYLLVSGAQGQSQPQAPSSVPPTALKDFLVFMGFKSVNGTVTGDQLYENALKECFSPNVKTDDEDEDDKGPGTGRTRRSPTSKDQKLPALRKLAKHVLQGLYSPSGGSSSNGTTPTTIRQMMLWLIGLPLTEAYKSNSTNSLFDKNGPVLQGIKSNEALKELEKPERLVKRTTTATGKHFKQQLKDSIVGMIMLFQRIEGGLGSVLEFLKEGFKDGSKFKYEDGTGDKSILKVFSTYVYKVHTQLRFLKVMCGTQKDQGGWERCYYANTSGPGVGSNITCGCLYAEQCCSLPLKHFLTNNGTNNGQNKNKFKLTNGSQKEHYKMGFKDFSSTTDPASGQLPTLKGSDLIPYLEQLIDKIPTPSFPATSKPLSLLTQYCVAIGQLEPQSLGDLFAFFAHLGQSWDNLKLYGNGEKFNQKLTEELKKYMIGNGSDKDSCDELQKKITAILNSEHSNHTNDRSLMSLMCSTSGCAPYMKSLSQGVYQYYLPAVNSNYVFGAFQYLYDMLRKLLDKMKALKGAFEKCPCCKQKNCPGLISCQYAHPILYKFGFVFGNPGTLKSGNKTCNTLKDQLTKVLSCTKGSESALFLAFECVIQVTYKVLLERGKGCVTTASGKWNGVQSKDITKDTITLYVEKAMDQSKKKFECTFLCKLFNASQQCDKHKDQQQASSSQTEQIVVTKSTVTCISAVIPQYTAPVIDPYHYRVFQRDSVTASGAEQNKDNTYDFQSAIDFHVKGANCIRPTPVALRSVIDWILRVTVGDTNGNNKMIQQLSGEVQRVLGSGVNKDEVEKHVSFLVSGLRTFMGYEDRSTEVKGKVGEALGTNGNGVKKLLEGKIDEIDKYLKNSGHFASELGKALLKGQYAFKQTDALETLVDMAATFADTLLGIDNKKNIHVRKNFKDAVKTFTEILNRKHDKCDSGLNCKSINTTNNGSAQDADQTDGLKILKEFFEGMKAFDNEIMRLYNNKNGGGILYSKYFEAQKSLKLNGDSSINGDVYFHKLLFPFSAIAEAIPMVEALINSNNVTDSVAYRGAIQGLSEKLRNEVLSCLTDGTEKKNTEANGENNNKADVRYAASAFDKVIKKTHELVKEEIIKTTKERIEGMYDYKSEASSMLNIATLIKAIEGVINSKCNEFKSHLDDLKQLCQWLYRMGQLYAHGLKGFVESLVKHLEHIVQVIKWIEKLEERLKWLNDKTRNFDSEDRRGIVGLCKVGIENLLHGTYVLNELPDGNGQKEQDKTAVATRRQFLRELRLLALDRYTLQVWQDECNNTSCNIKNWITFENGIIRHSDLSAIKQQLSGLTGIAYNSNASTPRNRIQNFHAICVIQKFSYQEPIAELERSLEKLRGIQKQLSDVKQKCDGSTTDVSNDTEITSFCTDVTQFLQEPYGIYSFAKFVHTILGPNIFSAVIGALEELKNKDQYNKSNGNDGNLEKIKGILGVMTEGFDGEKDQQKKDHYKLEVIISKLEAFMSTLRKEYIFCYPVVTSTATQAIVPAPQTPPAKIPKCENDDHSKSSICKHCYPYLVKIFIGAIPNLYRHCRLLYEMCRWKTDSDPVTASWHNDPLRYKHNGVHDLDYRILSFAGYIKAQGWTPKLERGPEGAFYDTAFEITGNKLFEALKDIVSIKDPFNDSDLKPLDKLFKAVMQHFKDERKKKKEEREEKLRTAFETKYKDSGLKFVPPPPPLPSTVRQVLFWLHEMDTNKALYDAMSKHINNLCGQSRIDITPSTILHVLNLSITQCLEVLATIEDPGRQNAQYLYELYTEEHYYDYPTVNIPLFFYTFVEKLMGAFLELNFVCVQCEFGALEGGWSECHIGKSEHSMEGQNCRCTKSHITVSSVMPRSVEGSVVCPRPLYSFLFGENTLMAPVEKKAYMSKGTMPCGFKLKNKASTDAASSTPTPAPTPTSVSGSVLVEPLRKLVGGHVQGRLKDTSTRNDENNTLNTVIYLRDLLRYTLCLAVRPPWSMSENMAFFYRVTESWKNKGVGGARVALRNDNLLGAIHAEIDMFPGTFDGTKLTSAVERFAGLDEKHKANGTHSNMSHQYDLRTLMGCKEANATSSVATPVLCSYFMFPLSLDVYTHYDERNSRAYLSWILNFAFGIYGQLRGLEEMIKEKECVMKSASQCPSLPMCPGVLTALYQSGSSFMDQGQLAKNTNAGGTTTTTKKTCADFHSVLTGLFNCDTTYCSPLHNLIVQCEAFLWSIRMPFSLVQLSLWSVAILFISYVFVVPLDHFKIKSHLFNRLKYTMHPSLLIADQQRRVSEVAYFSL